MANGAPAPADTGGGLSAEDQAFIDQEKARRAAAPPPAAPADQKQGGGDWFHQIVDPATRATAHVVSGLAQGVAATQKPYWPSTKVSDVWGAIKQNYYTPAEQLPTFAQEFIQGGISPIGAAEMIVPQTKTAAAIDAASLLMPEAKIAEMAGETLGPAMKFFGSRPGRVLTQTGVGALTGKVTGEGTGAGALQGLLASAPAEVFTGIKGAIGRKLGGPSLERQGVKELGGLAEEWMPWLRKAPGPKSELSRSQQVANAIRSRIPFLGKLEHGGILENGRDFAIQFRHGFATNDAANVMNRVINDVERQIPAGTGFTVSLPQSLRILNPGAPPVPQRMSFREVNQLIHDLQSKMAYGLSGEERGGISGQGAKELAHRIKENLVEDLNSIKTGGKQGLGDVYNRAKRKYDITKTMETIFKDPKLITRHGLDTNRLVQLLDDYAPELARGFGSDTAAQDLQKVLKRGFTGAATDVPGEPARAHVVAGGHFALPHMRVTPGAAPRPVGEIPSYMRPTAKKYEVLLSHLFGKHSANRQRPQQPQVLSALDQKRYETIAGPSAAPEQIASIGQMSKGVESGSPNVQADLNAGRVSLGHVRKVLDSQSGNRGDLSHVFTGLSPDDAISTLAKASPEDKDALLPALAQHLQNMGGKNMPPEQRQQMLAQLRAALGSGQEELA